MDYTNKDVISIKDFSKNEINHIITTASKMAPYAKGEKHTDCLKEYVLSSLFFEPSTRTRLSFESAMNRLGGRVIGFSEPGGTSLKKGESLADTIRMADAYSDAIVIRHPQEGAARLAAEFSESPVLNAKNYYRLEMGSLGNTRPVSVEVIILNEDGYSLQPNPVITTSRLVFKNDEAEEARVCIFDSMGRQVTEFLTRENHVIIHRNLLNSGNYVFKVLINNSVTALGKIVVI